MTRYQPLISGKAFFKINNTTVTIIIIIIHLSKSKIKAAKLVATHPKKRFLDNETHGQHHL